MKCVLVVDDDPHIREVVCFALEQDGFQTLVARDGVEALRQQRTHKPDLIVLDILMPELDGLAVCRSLREISQVPILLLSSRDEEVDRILGLEAGADDYIGKPFSPRELVARVKANLRREQIPREIQAYGYEMSEETHTAMWRQQRLDLTRTEFQLLQTLAAKPGRVFSRDELMKHAYSERRVVSHRTIDSHIRRLRDKLADAGAPGITTVHGIGFKLVQP
ncbi:MAG: response regulator [Pseudomonadales bacterium]|nr:response regulator [Pseudomonadales bacterium]